MRGLDAAGVPVIEVSHGDGLGGSSFNYGFSGTDERELISAAVEAATTARIAVLLLPGHRRRRRPARHGRTRGVAVARIATHCTEADIADQHIRLAKRPGHGGGRVPDDGPHGRAGRAAGAGPDHGVLRGRLRVRGRLGRGHDHRRRPGPGRRRWPRALGCQVGIHAHNNLSLAVANSLAALRGRRRPGRRLLRRAGRRAPATARPRCWWPSATSWASPPGSTRWRSWTWPRTWSGRMRPEHGGDRPGRAAARLRRGVRVVPAPRRAGRGPLRGRRRRDPARAGPPHASSAARRT